MQFPLQHSSLLINIWYDCTGPYLFDVSASSTEPIAAAGAGEGVMMWADPFMTLIWKSHLDVVMSCDINLSLKAAIGRLRITFSAQLGRPISNCSNKNVQIWCVFFFLLSERNKGLQFDLWNFCLIIPLIRTLSEGLCQLPGMSSSALTCPAACQMLSFGERV